MSKQMRELVASGLVERDSPRGDCRLAHPPETRAALEGLAILDHAIAVRREAIARARVEELRGDGGAS